MPGCSRCGLNLPCVQRYRPQVTAAIEPQLRDTYFVALAYLLQPEPAAVRELQSYFLGLSSTAVIAAARRSRSFDQRLAEPRVTIADADLHHVFVAALTVLVQPDRRSIRALIEEFRRFSTRWPGNDTACGREGDVRGRNSSIIPVEGNNAKSHGR